MLTFESIRDVERAERENKKMQRLPDEFFADMKEYLKKKRSDAAKNPDEIIEYQNIVTIVERLFEMREKKILEQALDSARIGIHAENIHRSEESLFSALSNALKSFRKDFFESLKAEEQLHKSGQKLFRIKEAVPEFVGPDMKTYRLKENDVVSLPEDIAKMLLEKGSIEEME